MEQKYTTPEASTINSLTQSNGVLYDQVTRMEKQWNILIKHMKQLEAVKDNLAREVNNLKTEVNQSTLRIDNFTSENSQLKDTINRTQEEKDKVKHKLAKRLTDLENLHKSFDANEESFNKSRKAWKEERRQLSKQKEEMVKRLESCETQIQHYCQENIKLDQLLKQVSSRYTLIFNCI